jgi:hypothetical protein
MIVINTVSSSRFSIDGIEYFKNFTPVARGNTIAIINAYDSRLDLSGAKQYDQYNVNSVVYATVELAQSALLPVLFSRTDASNPVTSSTTVLKDVSLDRFQKASTGNATVKSYVIPANTFADGDIMEIKYKMNRLTSSGNPALSLTVGSAVLVNLATSNTLDRNILLKNGDLYRMPTSGGYPTDLDTPANSINFTSNTGWSLTSNFTIDLKMNFTVTNTDEFELIFFTIKKVGTAIVNG